MCFFLTVPGTFEEPTCVRQVDNREENHSSSHGDSQEEQRLELVPSQSVLQVLQEGVDLQQNKHACEQTARFKRLRTARGDVSDGGLKEGLIFSLLFS